MNKEVNSVERLVIRLAENRAAMRKTKAEIGDLFCDGENYINIDLSEFRGHWYSFGYSWQGWMTAIEHFEDAEGEEAKPIDKTLAKLLDKKAELRQELGHIRRSLCAAGRKLLRDAQH